MSFSIEGLRKFLLAEVQEAALPLIQQLRGTAAVLPVLVGAEHRRLAAIRARLAEIECEIEEMLTRRNARARRLDFPGNPQPPKPAEPAPNTGFIGSMGLMAARSVLESAGFSLFGSEAPPPELFAEEVAPPGPSLLDRIAIGAFGVGLASLAVATLRLTQRIADLLWSRIKHLVNRRSHAIETKALVDAINEAKSRLSRLDAERQMLQRELEPEASRSFANALAEVKLAAQLDLSGDQIFSAFNSAHEGKKK